MKEEKLMEVTLAQLIHLAPELGSTLREDIRAGRLAASRKRGVAGRPYIIRTEDLEACGRPEYRELVDLAQHAPLATPVRTKRLGGVASASPLRSDTELFDIVESQHVMLKDLVAVLTQEMRARYDRLDRQQMQMQELSYKLGQAHQEIARLERMMAERSFSRIDEAK